MYQKDSKRTCVSTSQRQTRNLLQLVHHLLCARSTRVRRSMSQVPMPRVFQSVRHLSLYISNQVPVTINHLGVDGMITDLLGYCNSSMLVEPKSSCLVSIFYLLPHLNPLLSQCHLSSRSFTAFFVHCLDCSTSCGKRLQWPPLPSFFYIMHIMYWYDNRW